jgi:predicted DCC family thiol-disulfide oxidoreductase YuxK
MFLSSKHQHVREAPNDGPRFHENEYLFPITFTFDWSSRNHLPEKDDKEDGTLSTLNITATGARTTVKTTIEEPSDQNDRGIIEPTHVKSTLLGCIPIPLGFVRVRQKMMAHHDDKGWDLTVVVSAFGDRLNLITYEGSMRRTGEEFEEAEENHVNGTGSPTSNTTTTGQTFNLDFGAIAAEMEQQQKGVCGVTKKNDEQGVFVDGFHDLVLFDGTCNLCNATVDFLIRRDVDQRLLFAAQQSDEAQAALRRHGYQEVAVEGGEGDSVLVLGADGMLRAKSDAALRAGQALGGVWAGLATVASLIPTSLRDYMYDVVGRNRYNWFGKSETCRLPTLEERRHFL